MQNQNDIVNEGTILRILEETKKPKAESVFSVLKKAEEKKGLALRDAGILLHAQGAELKEALYRAAGNIKDEIYGERIVFFAPLYVSDFCVNNCLYCNFHTENKGLHRRKLALEEVERQTELLIDMGHKRLLLEFGEDPLHNDIEYVVKVIERIYSVKQAKGNIRRLNVNIAATTVKNYRKLKQAQIGTYQLFQETYHRKTYEALHPCGPKADYQRQLTAHLRAFEAGIDDLGIGVLFGLYDWKFEVLALLQHAQYLDNVLGVGPHTISVPRFCPAPSVSYKPEYAVSDDDFLKLIAILRLAVPYTGMIISTRETPEIRKEAFKIGISQASAASVASPGGYGSSAKDEAQFELHDQRPLAEVIKGVVEDKMLPSFCTACYRRGRTGEAFMELSKPGEIHTFCRSNGLLTFAEYLEDFGNGLYKKGYETIELYLNQIEDEGLRRKTQERLEKIKQGARDLYF
ncbi:MAG: [FeFe] hydrogenase H-cluster radical SAM maturase HydG [Omnitrophica WOR_2 bacterium GWF2_43_52]|nr:MAG: [FeFe] hydrogenase H-cluster radical SAM maturase HydG [Omnitrophica WOR_2 bacterium GWA2_44_7]OGX14618.1 MAG: [FeFe] hydrogenase H-cluster radical SAM maturase HydG [Omnitrophica WOR_2 bacterium GWC2_44_8]OGX22029.1 MAG: [FeFe] hydrogenase H-cluster radical SAM maturase HydG [Omnitrophica WOR_2 bacterium GWF2_43_52]HAH19998.1 [FeFe] hydrogenase H-cluster radical SAM maturase HydG [Candidatus Omnitrophota bacterium]HBG63166.1 [FeFe] hydrogenase H-cluster radical SAM maturase HydG [Candi